MDTYIYTAQSTYKYKDRAIQTSIMGQQQRPKSAGWFLFPGSQSTRQNQSPTKRDDQQITCFFFFFFFVFLFIYPWLPMCFTLLLFFNFFVPPSCWYIVSTKILLPVVLCNPASICERRNFVRPLLYILLSAQAKRFPPQHRVLIAENGFIFLLGPRAYLCNEL